jgi:hypothetical protein
MKGFRPNKFPTHLNKSKKGYIKLPYLGYLEVIALVFSFWFLVYPHPYDFLFTVLVIIPPLGLFINGLQRPSLATLISITKEDGELKYDVIDFIDLPALVLFLRVLLDFEYESFSSILIVGSVTFVITMIILFSTHKLIEEKIKDKWYVYVSIIFNIALYSYAGTYGINCIYDNSEAVVYETRIISKRIGGGKSKARYIKVQPWGSHREEEEITVSSKEYEKMQTGELIKIDVHKGLFGIPWYYVE